jgi:hypothetical protein
MKVYCYGTAGLGRKRISQRKEHVLGWNLSNFATERWEMCGTCSGKQERAKN